MAPPPQQLQVLPPLFLPVQIYLAPPEIINTSFIAKCRVVIAACQAVSIL